MDSVCLWVGSTSTSPWACAGKLILQLQNFSNHWWNRHARYVAIASHGVPLVLDLVSEDLYLPVLHVVHTQPGLVTNTVQNLIIPVLHR